MLTHQATYPVNKASIEKLGADWIKPGNLVSNGAFTLAEFVPNDHIKLVKNPEVLRCGFRQARRRQLHSDRGSFHRDQALRGGRARLQRRSADRTIGRPQGEVRRPAAYRPVSSAPTTTPSRPTRSRGAIPSCATPCPWRSTATSLPRKSGRARCFPAIRWCLPVSRAMRRRRPRSPTSPSSTARMTPRPFLKSSAMARTIR